MHSEDPQKYCNYLPIMCQIRSGTYYAKNDAGIIGQGLISKLDHKI